MTIIFRGNPGLLLPSQGCNPDLPSQHRCPKSDVSAEVCSPPKMFPAIITFCDISSFCRKVFFYVKLFLIFSSDSMLFPKIYDLNPSQQFCYLSLAALNDKTHETQAFPPTLLLLGVKWFGVLMFYIFTFTRALRARPRKQYYVMYLYLEIRRP